jgi:hypothetical protein
MVPGGRLRGVPRPCLVSCPHGFNNPVNSIDPSGHRTCEYFQENGQCVTLTAYKVLKSFGITASGLTINEKWNLAYQATIEGEKFANAIGGSISTEDAFKLAHGSIIVRVGEGRGPDPSDGNCITNTGTIDCNTPMDDGTALHEFYHIFDFHYRDISTGNSTGCGGDGNCLASNYFDPSWVYDENYNTVAYNCGTIECGAHPPHLTGYNYAEAFANLGEYWVLDSVNIDKTKSYFADNPYGVDLQDWMNNNMHDFLDRMGLLNDIR